MTKAEAFDKAWKLAFKGDFSVYNEIVHPHYESLNQGVKVDREVSKAVLQNIGTFGKLGPSRVIMKMKILFAYIGFRDLSMKTFSSP
jgi:c-di-GMP-related signal transduction protein